MEDKHLIVDNIRDRFSNFKVNPSTLKEIRTKANITIKEFAAMCGVSGALIYRIEDGSRTCTPAILRKYECLKDCKKTEIPEISDALDVSEFVKSCDNCNEQSVFHSVEIIPNNSNNPNTWGKRIRHLCVGCSKLKAE